MVDPRLPAQSAQRASVGEPTGQKPVRTEPQSASRCGSVRRRHRHRHSVLGYWLCRIVGGGGPAGRALESSPADLDVAGRMLQDSAERVAIKQIPEFQVCAEYVETPVSTEPLEIGRVHAALHSDGEQSRRNPERGLALWAGRGSCAGRPRRPPERTFPVQSSQFSVATRSFSGAISTEIARLGRIPLEIPAEGGTRAPFRFPGPRQGGLPHSAQQRRGLSCPV